MPKEIDINQSYRLLNHGPTVLVTSSHGDNSNIMAAAWNMPLDFEPPKVAIVIDKNTYTRELMEASGTFAINVPCKAQAEMVVRVGNSSGRELLSLSPDNKFSVYGIPTFPANNISAPLVAGCVAWLECRIIPEPHIQNTYDLFLAEVLSAQADERVFSNGHWCFDGHDELRTIHHVAGGTFMPIGDPFKGSRPAR